MRKILTTSLLTLSLISAAPVFAKSQGYDSTITEPLNSSVKIEVVLSEDMAHRANNLPKKLKDRNGSRGLNAGFSNNGFYGDKDLQRLSERLQSKLEKSFARRGIEVSDTASTILRVKIADAKPNRPTFGQLKRQSSLSFQSIGIGGAELEGELIAAGGQSLGTMNYRWYENNIHHVQFGGTWSDAHRAFSRYARKAAKTLSN